MYNIDVIPITPTTYTVLGTCRLFDQSTVLYCPVVESGISNRSRTTMHVPSQNVVV